MLLSEKEKLEAKLLLEELEIQKTELGVYLVKAIKDSTNIPKELKEGFIVWVGAKEAEIAHRNSSKKLSRYDSRTLELRKHWWKFW